MQVIGEMDEIVNRVAPCSGIGAVGYGGVVEGICPVATPELVGPAAARDCVSASSAMNGISSSTSLQCVAIVAANDVFKVHHGANPVAKV